MIIGSLDPSCMSVCQVSWEKCTLDLFQPSIDAEHWPCQAEPKRDFLTKHISIHSIMGWAYYLHDATLDCFLCSWLSAGFTVVKVQLADMQLPG